LLPRHELRGVSNRKLNNSHASLASGRNEKSPHHSTPNVRGQAALLGMDAESVTTAITSVGDFLRHSPKVGWGFSQYLQNSQFSACCSGMDTTFIESISGLERTEHEIIDGSMKDSPV
jgi:hypothetical protein